MLLKGDYLSFESFKTLLQAASPLIPLFAMNLNLIAEARGATRVWPSLGIFSFKGKLDRSPLGLVEFTAKFLDLQNYTLTSPEF